MKTHNNVLGIDIGSVSIYAVVLDSDGKIAYKSSCMHHGEIKHSLIHILEEIDLEQVSHVAATDAVPSFIRADRSYDEQLTIIRAAQYFHDSFDAILHIGGEKFSLSRFDCDNNYIGARHNTSCAAGTGSFLDQQARRLNLAGGSRQLSEKAEHNKDKIPDIATRCAVFAKTDLIHAQQEGYSIEQICDGLCYGLARNIFNTLFKHSNIGEKIIFCGGVSENTAVKNHLEKITGYKFITSEDSKFFCAAGAALCLLDDLAENRQMDSLGFSCPDDFFTSSDTETIMSYPGLELKLSDYPDFTSFDSYIHHGVEVEIYQDPSCIDTSQGYLGLDVGSTSTKSILINKEAVPIAGFYTKTASRPVMAVQKIFRAYENFFDAHGIDIRIKGCGTTGSGRRLSAKIIGADIEPDEITAHARAAVHLNPDVDTIIEIGGQDAKFTLVKNGIVTSSVMNTVCAAGTGSFIEEQALKLDCPLSEYSKLAEGVESPVASDRCTVFMERDINYYFARGYRKNEILASVLHSVRDNYLTKVATMGRIGRCILFQGATARNRALVAAFEQKLEKPIHVSRYCHLTGALGIALLAREKNIKKSGFRGFDLWKHDIPVRQETCQLCTNHCKITIADIDGHTLAYGFLCGRDYQTKKKVVKKNTHNLLKLRRKAVPSYEYPSVKHDFTIGIPDTLHLAEDNAFWVHFFRLLGVRTKTPSGLKNPVKMGKAHAGAEFCAPIVALHGQVQYLAQNSDYIFLPYYFEEKSEKKDRRRQHCYYTQFSVSIISCIPGFDRTRLVSPIIRYLYTNFHTKLELYKALKKISSDFSFFDISNAYDNALEFKEKIKAEQKAVFKTQMSGTSDINVVFVGRPYTILNRALNNNIPGLFENLGVRTFFQDMLDFENHDFSSIDPLLREIHWKYLAQILKAAHIAAVTDNLYPVYISSFRCSPDSFGIDYFKQIMEACDKPYLVLTLDEHDSSVGYETRVEAAVQAFHNHHRSRVRKNSSGNNMSHLHPNFTSSMKDKTIIMPNWDVFSGSLVVSVLRKEGFNAILMEESEHTLKKSILTNTGQCIPLNALAAGFIHTIEKKGLDPSRCVLWLNDSEIACNIKMYPYHIKKILEKTGMGFEKAGVYVGELSLIDLSFKACTHTYFAYMFGGLLRSMGCRIRPYEVNRGETDRALEKALKILCNAFENGTSREKALEQAVKLVAAIRTRKQNRPKIGIFGDLYVRENDIMNQDLIHYIEDNGGEVITTPYYKYVKIIANSYFRKWFKEKKYFSLISNRALFVVMQAMEKKYYKYFEPVLDKSWFEVKDIDENILGEYGILQEHTGESMDNILKIHHLMHEHPDLALLVQTNPAFCCPGLITEAMAQKIEEKINVPIVSITYDISGGNKNRVIIPFLKGHQNRHYFQSLKAFV